MTTADIDREKTREAARLLTLVEAERRYYQEILVNVPSAIAVVAADLTLVEVSKRFRAMFGLRREQLSRTSLESLLADEPIAREIAEAIQSATPWADVETEFWSASGKQRVKISLQPLPGWSEDAGPEAILLVEEGVSDWPSQQPVDTAIPGVVWERDPHTLEFRSVGGGARTLLGFPAEQWLERGFINRTVHPDDRPFVEHYYARALPHGLSGGCEFRAMRADGATVWLRDLFRVVLDSRGEPDRIAGVTVDVTEEKLQEALALQAEKGAAIARFAGKLTHGSNNLVTLLASYVEDIAGKLPDNHPARRDAEEFVTAARRLTSIATDLMPFIRPPAIHPESVDINSLLMRLQSQLESAMGPGFRVDFLLTRESLWASADPRALADAVLEIAGHVKQALEKAGRLEIATSITELGEARAELVQGLPPGQYVTLTLSDNGPDLDPETQIRVFEPGFACRRVSRSLAAVYQSVKLMGGDFLVCRGPEGGALFTLYLPRVKAAEKAKGALVPAPVERPQPAAKTVLVVEDEGGIKALLRKVLQKQGYTVLEANGGEEAMRIAEEHRAPIHLLLTDVVMPRINGYELAYRLRTARPYMRVLFVSGYAAEDLAAYGAAPSGSEFLQKPFSLATLIDRAKDIMDEGESSFQAWAI